MAVTHNTLIQSTRADGYLSALEIEMSRAAGRGDEQAFANATRELSKTRPVTAVRHVQSRLDLTEVERASVRLITGLIALRSELISQFAKQEDPAAAAHLAQLCAETSRREAAAVTRRLKGTSEADGQIANAIDSKRASASVAQAEYERLMGCVPWSEEPSVRTRATIARVTAIFARKEDGPEDARADSRLRSLTKATKASVALAAVAGPRSGNGAAFDHN
jgi:hypothetical protein